jgi:chemotaxis protein methyltransferase CheR
LSSPTTTFEGIDAVCNLVHDLCGIVWDESKAYLIEARLGSLIHDAGCENYLDLVEKVRAEIVPGLKEQVVDAVTTNETLWFRDSSPFEALKFKVLPEMVDAKSKGPSSKRLRIWSAACSTGQEAYSIAMTIADTIPDVTSWDVQIIGTDISPAAVQQATAAEYNTMEMGRGMDDAHLQTYMLKYDKLWRVIDPIRKMCTFKTFNLHQPFVGLETFDIVFCRNVAIYFSAKDRRTLFNKIKDVLLPSGWVFVGSSESLSDIGPDWQPQNHCRANCYRPNMTACV